MKSLRFPYAAVLAAILTSASLAGAGVPANPSIDLVDNGDGTVTLQVIPDSAFLPGSTAVELDVVFSGGLSIDGVGSLSGGADIVIGDPAIYDTSNPGFNPFTGGVTFGISPDYPNDRLFVSYGSAVINSPGPVDLLLIDYDGTSGTVTAGGNANIVAQAATLNFVTPISLEIGAPPVSPADFDMDGDVDLDDFGVFVLGFQNSPAGGPPFDVADFDMDGDVDLDDFGVFVLGFQSFPPPSVAVPEPGGALLVALALSGFASLRRRR